MTNFFWFRRDLRLDDNAGLYHALKSGKPVQPVFIFDTEILDNLDDKNDRRVAFIHNQLAEINESLKKTGSSLLVMHGRPQKIWQQLMNEYKIETVFTNHDYEPYAIKRDEEIKQLLEKKNISFKSYKDQVIFERDEIVKSDGSPYTVFTPYMKQWKKKFEDLSPESFSLIKHFDNFHKSPSKKIPSLNEIGFNDVKIDFPVELPGSSLLKNYSKLRDFPSMNGTTRIGIHLRFGTISIRKLASMAKKQSETFLNELIWREFFMSLLWHFPHAAEKAFKPAYEFLPWINDEKEFGKWCNGNTGYPIVDAGMRELNATGFMHNRVRMITAMFLTKYLLIDWRWGEAYFAKKLNDFELASNNGNWQWCAGTGADAAPYFRIFSMSEQTKRFDPEHKYIKKWVPEYQDFNYPAPMIDYAFARKRCIDFYKNHVRI